MSRLGYIDPIHSLLPLARGLVRRPTDPAPAEHSTQIVGHRGCPRLAPENTVASFRKAVSQGADAIEADLCITRDGAFVLWHDEDPDEKVALLRQSGGEGLFAAPCVPAVGSRYRRRVSELRLAEMRFEHGYRVYWERELPRGSTAMYTFDTLYDLLGLLEVEPRLRDVYLDLKIAEDQSSAARDFVSALRGWIGRGAKATFHLMSPRAEIAELLLSLVSPADTKILVYPDFELAGAVPIAHRLGARNVSMGGGRLWATFHPELRDVLSERHAERLDRVVVWTFNEETQLAELVRLGINAILTDDIPLLHRISCAGRGTGELVETPEAVQALAAHGSS